MGAVENITEDGQYNNYVRNKINRIKTKEREILFIDASYDFSKTLKLHEKYQKKCGRPALSRR